MKLSRSGTLSVCIVAIFDGSRAFSWTDIVPGRLPSGPRLFTEAKFGIIGLSEIMLELRETDKADWLSALWKFMSGGWSKSGYCGELTCFVMIWLLILLSSFDGLDRILPDVLVTACTLMPGLLRLSSIWLRDRLLDKPLTLLNVERTFNLSDFLPAEFLLADLISASRREL